MPKIFEVFGYPLTDTSQEAIENRKACRCPFMDAPCDGGGNRYLSNVKLNDDPLLRAYFNDQEEIPSGVCSIQVRPEEEPWVVCPRRLLCLGRKDSGSRAGQHFAERLLLSKCDFPANSKIGVWSEVKMIYKPDSDSHKHFDYTFDYVLMPIADVDAHEAAKSLGVTWARLAPIVEAAGYSVRQEHDHFIIEGFPRGAPIIVEIMTSSTSGGNKTKASTIPMAFLNAIKGKEHLAPGINYRQVWARMVSQLIVKSEVALSWGGLTFWVLQDNLINYISSSTALDIKSFVSEGAGEVNILGLSYGDGHRGATGITRLEQGVLYAGDIGPPPNPSSRPYFQDMVKAPIKPPLVELLKLLVRRTPTQTIIS